MNRIIAYAKSARAARGMSQAYQANLLWDEACEWLRLLELEKEIGFDRQRRLDLDEWGRALRELQVRCDPDDSMHFAAEFRRLIRTGQ